MFKKANIVILPTEDKNPVSVPFLKMDQKNKLINHCTGGEFRKFLSFKFEPQHMYIILDERPKAHEWFVETVTNTVWQHNGEVEPGQKAMKIIATTDNSIALLINDPIIGKAPTFHPVPSKSFINKYIEAYNNDTPITECLVEINHLEYKSPSFPRVNTNNEINIKSIKNSWNREEVRSLLLNYHNYVMTTKSDANTRDQWIKENL